MCSTFLTSAFAVSGKVKFVKFVFHPVAFLSTVFSGIDLKNKRVLIKKEQGLGDELFFLRFLPRLKSLGAWLAYHTDVRLIDLISTLPFIDLVTDDAACLNNVDFVFMVGDLPR